MSIKGGVQNSPLNAAKIGASTFALFTRNQRRWIFDLPDAGTVRRFKENCCKEGFQLKDLLVHDSYLINPGSPDKRVLSMSKRAFHSELRRCSLFGLERLVFHPGSHRREMSDVECLDQVAGFLNEALSKVPGVTAVVENTSGSGGNVGYRFEHLAFIVDKIEDKRRIGVCLDTCHLFAAGYDIRTPESYEKTFRDFEETVGFKYLKGIHLNDSKGALGSRTDRHDSLGCGELSLTPFRLVMEDPRMEDIPIILETPDQNKWKDEIRMLYEFLTYTER